MPARGSIGLRRLRRFDENYSCLVPSVPKANHASLRHANTFRYFLKKMLMLMRPDEGFRKRLSVPGRNLSASASVSKELGFEIKPFKIYNVVRS